MGNEVIAPQILNLRSIWRWVVSFMPLSLWFWGQGPQ